LQTATRRLLTTHPYSLDFPFVFLLFVLARDSALAPLGVFASPWVANPLKGRLSPTARKIAFIAIGSKPNKKRPSGTKPEGLKKA
jgi:hypothetical protein